MFTTRTDNDKRLEKLYTLRAESLFYLAIHQSIIKLGFPRGLSQKTLISLDS
jgi:hypothetical protein